MKIKGSGEDTLIRELSRGFPRKTPRVVLGIGDDTSVSTQSPDKVCLATTDILVEGRHFMAGSAPAYLIGKKALGVSLSDIAAMGGEPVFFLVSIGLPAATDEGFVKELYKGIKSQSRKFATPLVGGNTTGARELMVSTTVVGEMPSGEVVYRSGARPGDVLFVTGELGGAALGLKVLKDDGYERAVKGHFRKEVLRHLDPAPRLKAGRVLAKKGLARAMMDISDGLMLDLNRLCEASGTGAVVRAGALPMSPGLKRLEKLNRTWAARARTMALTGGEDYELLFACPPDRAKRIKGTAKALGVKATEIGRITGSGEGVRAIDESGRAIRLVKTGYEHF